MVLSFLRPFPGTIDAMSAAESKISEILRFCHQQEMSKYPPHGSETSDYYSPTRFRENNNNNSSNINHNHPAATAANSPYSNYLARGGGRGGGGASSHLVGQPAMMGAGLVDAASMNHNNGPPMLPHHHTQMPPPQFGKFDPKLLAFDIVVLHWFLPSFDFFSFLYFLLFLNTLSYPVLSSFFIRFLIIILSSVFPLFLVNRRSFSNEPGPSSRTAGKSSLARSQPRYGVPLRSRRFCWRHYRWVDEDQVGVRLTELRGCMDGLF